MSMNFNSSPPPASPKPKKKDNHKQIAVIIIVLVLVSIGAVVIIEHVMSVQDSFDEAGIKFTKMDNGLLSSSLERPAEYPDSN